VLYFITPNWSYSQSAQSLEDKLSTNHIDNSELDKLSADDLVDRGAKLLIEQRSIDARTVLLKALEKNPKLFRAHILLSNYYLGSVGHFRLAQRYINRAKELFEEVYGRPPYTLSFLKAIHQEILYYIIQTELNLDNYPESLKVVEQFENEGYFAEWLHSTKAWILMKMGKLAEAESVAREGIFLFGQSGRSLNILAILLSMQGETNEALKIFKQAVEIELSLGGSGQPATPLNNSGEVYKELFEDRRAEAAWIQSKSLPDGCEHVLPSLNLALLRIDHLNLSGAKDSIETFLHCFEQFPMRNGEEHHALIALARGRLALHSGKPFLAISLFNEALERVQWFGKIGTSAEDLYAGALTSLGLAYEFANNHLSYSPTSGIFEAVINRYKIIKNKVAAWWAHRQARIILIKQLNSFEDLKIRNTDSLLEYPTLGSLLGTLPGSLAVRRLNQQITQDPRVKAHAYYKAYIAEASSRKNQSLIYKQALSSLRPHEDRLLWIHINARLLKLNLQSNKKVNEALHKLFRVSPSAIRNYGLFIPVFARNSLSDLAKAFAGTPILIQKDPTQDLSIEATFSENGKVTFIFYSSSQAKISATGEDINSAAKLLLQKVFVL
jgi:tetratricopeptide (TPR) repeat protein